MKYWITGADRGTGDYASIVVNAESHEAAEQIAHDRGVLISDVHPLSTPSHRKAGTEKVYIIGIVAFSIFVGLYFSQQWFAGDDQQVDTAPSVASEQNEPDLPRYDVSPVDYFKERFEHALGRRCVRKVYFDGPDQKWLQISFKIQDSLTIGWTRDGAYDDMVKILEVVDNAPVTFERVFIRALGDLRDKYGNTQEGQVMFAGFLGEDIARMNFSGLTGSDVPRVADHVGLHPDLRRDND